MDSEPLITKPRLETESGPAVPILRRYRGKLVFDGVGSPVPGISGIGKTYGSLVGSSIAAVGSGVTSGMVGNGVGVDVTVGVDVMVREGVAWSV